MLDEKLVAVSFQSIAEVCNCSSELVQIFFQLLKDEIIDLVMGKKQSVILSFYIGKLNINPTGVVQFCSNSIESVLKLQRSQ